MEWYERFFYRTGNGKVIIINEVEAVLTVIVPESSLGKTMLEDMAKADAAKTNHIKDTSLYPFTNLNMEPVNPGDFGLGRVGNPSSFGGCRGRFFVSKKGSNCFEQNPAGPHIMLHSSWGGDHRVSDLRTKELPGVLWQHHYRSNGGGIGSDTVIVPVPDPSVPPPVPDCFDVSE